MADTNTTGADTAAATPAKRKYDKAFATAFCRYYNRPGALSMSKVDWEEELKKDVIDIELYDLLVTLVSLKLGTNDAVKLASIEAVVNFMIPANHLGSKPSLIEILKDDSTLLFEIKQRTLCDDCEGCPDYCREEPDIMIEFFVDYDDCKDKIRLVKGAFENLADRHVVTLAKRLIILMLIDSLDDLVEGKLDG